MNTGSDDFLCLNEELTMKVTRRQFLGTSASAVVAAGMMTKGGVLGANDRVRVAVMGLHSRGMSHVEGFGQLDGAEVAALCDPDRDVLAGRASEVKEMFGKTPKTYVDMRDVFADDNIDVVSFATPNHWHVLGSIWACQAGKDVYVEKPMSHTLWEGRQLVAAAKKYNRIVQHGTQRRSFPHWQRAIERVRQGVIGDIYMARVLVYVRRDSIGFYPDSNPPGNLEWGLWQGPAPEQPYNRNYVHYNWHWFWHYGNGDLGNNSVHYTDIANWALDKGLPERIYSVGGRFGYQDQGETPNTQVCNFTYPDGTVLVIEVRGRATNLELEDGTGLLLYGSEGYMADWKLYDMDRQEIPDEQADVYDKSQSIHFENFLSAVRSRKEEDIHGTALDGHIASALCHLANISYRLGRELRFDPKKEIFPSDPEADELLTRSYRNGFEVAALA